jgi:hypothetical protein
MGVSLYTANSSYPAGSHPNAPASSSADITPNDTTQLPVTTRALWIGTGGNLSVQLVGDNVARTFTNIPSGSIMPLACAFVMQTNTTCSGIVALF